MSRGDVFHYLLTLHPSRWLWNVFKINLIPVQNQQNQQRSLFVNNVLNTNPHMFLLWPTPSINKFFSERSPFIIHTRKKSSTGPF